MSLLPLAGCAPYYRYRYKLTLKVDDHGVPRQASSVVQKGLGISHLQLDGGSRLTTYAKGEATVLELGDGRLLIATLGKRPPEPELNIPKSNWSEGAGELDVLIRAYGVPPPRYEGDVCVGMNELIAHRGACPIGADDLPDTVTFLDKTQPMSIRMVDCHDLAASFGPGVTFAGATLEFTDEPVSHYSIKATVA